ncbi:MAG: DUF2628 domain-containing protein [Pseudomonadota bacterium]
MFGTNEKQQALLADIASVSWDEMAAFIGPGARFFEGPFSRMKAGAMEGKIPFWVGFSWAALFFTFAWFWYRKMWLIGAAFLLTPIAFALLLPDVNGVTTGIAGAAAATGKRTYLTLGVQRIVAEREGRDLKNGFLYPSGGVSIPGALLGGFVFGLAIWAVFATA